MTTTHTPEQARALWCPMVRIARNESITIEKAAIGDIVHVTEQRYIVGGCNTDALGGLRVPASCRCIADQCAMWRWATRPIKAEDDCNVDLSQSIDVLATSARIKNALKRAGIYSLQELVVLRFTDLNRIQEISTKTIKEIKAALADIGLELSMRQDTNHKPGTGYCGIAGRPEVAA